MQASDQADPGFDTLHPVDPVAVRREPLEHELLRHLDVDERLGHEVIEPDVIVSHNGARRAVPVTAPEAGDQSGAWSTSVR